MSKTGVPLFDFLFTGEGLVVISMTLLIANLVMHVYNALDRSQPFRAFYTNTPATPPANTPPVSDDTGKPAPAPSTPSVAPKAASTLLASACAGVVYVVTLPLAFWRYVAARRQEAALRRKNAYDILLMKRAEAWNEAIRELETKPDLAYVSLPYINSYHTYPYSVEQIAAKPVTTCGYRLGYPAQSTFRTDWCDGNKLYVLIEETPLAAKLLNAVARHKPAPKKE